MMRFLIFLRLESIPLSKVGWLPVDDHLKPRFAMHFSIFALKQVVLHVDTAY